MINKLSEFVRAKRGDMSLRDFGRMCDNLSHTQIDCIEKGYDPRTGKPIRPTVDTLARIAKGTGAPVSFLAALANGDAVEDIPLRGVKIPVLGRVVAGIPIEAVTDIIDYEEIPEALAKTGEFFALKVQGDSMSPRICDGDVVIVRKQEEVESGEVAIVMVNGDEATIKEVRFSAFGLTLVGWNVGVYPPHFYPIDEVQNLPVRIIGKVVELRGKF